MVATLWNSKRSSVGIRVCDVVAIREDLKVDGLPTLPVGTRGVVYAVVGGGMFVDGRSRYRVAFRNGQRAEYTADGVTGEGSAVA